MLSIIHTSSSLTTTNVPSNGVSIGMPGAATRCSPASVQLTVYYRCDPPALHHLSGKFAWALSFT